MPFNGLGTFNRVYSWVTDASNNLNVDATRTDTDTNDIAAGLSLCITKDGQQTVTNNIPMNSHKFTGLSAGSGNGDSVRWEQISAIATWAATPSSANLAAAVTDETGTGLLVFNTSPTFVTPNIGAATGTSVTMTGARSEFRANSEIFAVGVRYNSGTGVFYIGASNSASPDLIFSEGGGGERFRITNDGRVYGTGLHNNAGAVTGTVNQYVASGTYTPTVSATSNVASSTPLACQWSRLGNTVTVSGSLNVFSTTATGNTSFGLSLPIPSTFASAAESICAGTFSTEALIGGGFASGLIRNNTSTNVATFEYSSSTTANSRLQFIFQYLVA